MHALLRYARLYRTCSITLFSFILVMAYELHAMERNPKRAMLDEYLATERHFRYSFDTYTEILSDAKAGEFLAALDTQGRPLLHEAAEKDRINLVLALLEGGANVNARDAQGNTALHCAAAHERNYGTVHQLIAAGANVNATNTTGQTALHYAQSATIVSTLIESGADCPFETFAQNNAQTRVQVTPFQMALEQRNERILIAMLHTVSPQEVNSIIPKILAEKNKLDLNEITCIKSALRLDPVFINNLVHKRQGLLMQHCPFMAHLGFLLSLNASIARAINRQIVEVNNEKQRLITVLAIRHFYNDSELALLPSELVQKNLFPYLCPLLYTLKQQPLK
ncbi:MAG: ankyrin repeat domain-containing protein [Candidatus Babeliales bacterium]